MRTTLTVRLIRELASWLVRSAAATGQSRGQIVRDALERARVGGKRQAFMAHAGAVYGKPDLSARKAFSRS